MRGVRGSIREVGEEDIESDKENELAEDDADAHECDDDGWLMGRGWIHRLSAYERGEYGQDVKRKKKKEKHTLFFLLFNIPVSPVFWGRTYTDKAVLYTKGFFLA